MSDKENKIKTGGKSLYSAGGLILVFIILVLVNLVFSKVNLRWDATHDKLYSLSDGSKKILSDLKQDTVIKVFYSKDVPNIPVHIKNYAKRMLDFLYEYENYSKGKVKVEVYNPKPDSDIEEWANKYGIEGANLPTGEKIYFGIVVTAADQEETIPMLDPAREQQLEYDITRLIVRVQSSKKPVVGIISSLPVFGGPVMGMQGQKIREPWLFIKELGKSYKLKEIRATAEKLDDDLDFLIIIHPKNLNDQLLYSIDQYVMKGGHIMAIVDPFCVSDMSRGASRSSNLGRLFKSWGIKLEPDKVIADYTYATRLRTQNNKVENNPMWLSVLHTGLNKDAIITSQLDSILFPVAGAIKKTGDSKYEYTSLVKSSANSALIPAIRARFGSADDIKKNFKASPDQYDIAIEIKGKFKTAFPDGKPEKKKDDKKSSDAKDKDNNSAHLASGKEDAVIIVISDADFLFDNYYVSHQNFFGFKISRMFNDNLNFVLNTSEMLTGNKALISIRSRGKFERPFIRVKELEKKAQMKWLAREQELMRKVEETNAKLRQLEGKQDKSQKFIISEEQEKEIRKFQKEKLRIKKELKKVRRNLRVDIERLGYAVKFINIFLMVIVIAIIGIFYGLYRKKGQKNA